MQFLKDHISCFSTGSGIANFEKGLSEYKKSKGTINIPLKEVIPLDIIKKIVEFREEKAIIQFCILNFD